MPPPPHPDDLDALVAAPDHHHLLYENEAVRVLDITVPPGHTVPLHTHCWPGILHFLSWSDCIRRDAQGIITMDSRNAPPLAPGATVWCPALGPHTLQNIGSTALHVLGVELKSPISPHPPTPQGAA